jgi:hypothetical protein
MQDSQLASQHHRVLHQLVTSVRPGSRRSASVSTAQRWQAGMLQYRALLASNAGMTDTLSVCPVHRSAISASSKDWRAQHCKPDPTGICRGGGRGGCSNVCETDVLQTAASSRRWGRENRWRPRRLDQPATPYRDTPKYPRLKATPVAARKRV